VGGFLPYSYSSFGYSSFGGFGGLNYYNGPVGGFIPYGPYGYTSFGYPGFGPYYGYLPAAPTVIPTSPVFIGPNLADNPAIQEWMPKPVPPIGNANPAAAQPLQADVPVFVKPTTPEAKRKSIRYQAQGDEWFLKQNYLQAYARYKQAYSAAADRPEPRFRMAIALAALTEFGPAVDELKRLARLDPEMPAHGERLDDLFGPDRNLAKNAVLHKVADWVKEDIRDPDRLYLMGVLLYFNEDGNKAKTLFETAGMLAGDPAHVRVFLAPAAGRRVDAQRAAPKPPAPPPPDPREEDEAPVPMPQAGPAPPQPAPAKPARELAGPRLLLPGAPAGVAPDER
jgi:Flp pilus assembly protein TadD